MIESIKFLPLIEFSRVINMFSSYGESSNFQLIMQCVLLVNFYDVYNLHN